MDDAKMRVMASLGNMSGQPLLLSTGFPQKLAGSYFGRGQAAQTDKEKEALIRMEQGLPPEKTPEEIQQEQQQQQQPQQKQSMSQGRMMAELPPDMRSQSGSVDQERARAQESLRIQQEMDAQRRMNEERSRQEQMRRRT